MHCMGELMEPMAKCRGFRCGLRTSWRAFATPAIMRSEPIAIRRSASSSLMLRAEAALAVGIHGLDDVADEAAVLRPPGFEAGLLVAAPDHRVGGVLDIRHLVAVDDFLVAGEIKHLG